MSSLRRILKCAEYKKKRPKHSELDTEKFYPMLGPTLLKMYKMHSVYSVREYMKGFVFVQKGRKIGEPHVQTSFDLMDPSSLRVRYVFLYWVQLHTGKVNSRFTFMLRKLLKPHREGEL